MENRLSPKLLEVLVCPEDKSELLYIEDENILYNPRLRKSYDVLNSIPVLLIENATQVDEETHEKYMAKDHVKTGS